MRKWMNFYCLPILFLFIGTSALKSQSLVLRYNQPANDWNEALPIGNGRLGAMVFGTLDEHFQLNENTLYSGEPSNVYKQVNITSTYDSIVSLLRKEEYLKAGDIVQKNWLGRLHHSYQPLGDLYLKSNSPGVITSYSRELDIKSSILRISYMQNGAKFVREVFASHPSGVIVVRITADQPVIDFTASLSSIHPTASQHVDCKGVLHLDGQAPGYVGRRAKGFIKQFSEEYKHPELYDSNGNRKYHQSVLYGDEVGGLGMYFNAQLQIIAPKGHRAVTNQGIRVSNTNEVILLLSAATSYNGYTKSPSKEGVNQVAKATEALTKASKRSFAALRKEHIADYQGLFNRVQLTLHSSVEQTQLPTNERLAQNSGRTDPDFEALIFQYGRYLMISGSRPGGQPLNLQGIWNKDTIPAWNSAYTMNINLEMNYWPAEQTNLSECHEPMFRLIKEIAESGKETARKMYNRNGWVGHHCTSIWREAFPNDFYNRTSSWPMLGAWLSSHLWEHYLYTGDRTFLKEEAYPVMKSACEFYTDWLIDDGKGYLVTPVSTSPENVFATATKVMAEVSMGSTMDMTLLRELFSRTIRAAQMVEDNAPLQERLTNQLAKMLPFQIGAKGQIQEWQHDFKDWDPEHRHLSHLYGLHPGNQITPDATPALFEAARQSMLIRGDKAVGWSMGWKANMWARLLDGDHAHKIISNLLVPAGSGAGLYMNLLDACPPFEIDGNFGYTSGITEMLLQSHAGFVHLLPALPSVWAKGEVKGLRTRGGFEIDMQWEKGCLTRAVVRSTRGGVCRLRTAQEVQIANSKAVPAVGMVANDDLEPYSEGTTAEMSRRYHTIDFETQKGKQYIITVK